MQAGDYALLVDKQTQKIRIGELMRKTPSPPFVSRTSLRQAWQLNCFTDGLPDRRNNGATD
jgi:hypothetical protein